MWTKMWTHCRAPECKADISHLRVVSEVSWGKWKYPISTVSRCPQVDKSETWNRKQLKGDTHSEGKCPNQVPVFAFECDKKKFYDVTVDYQGLLCVSWWKQPWKHSTTFYHRMKLMTLSTLANSCLFTHPADTGMHQLSVEWCLCPPDECCPIVQ